jgi:hypothetical protein
VKEEQGFREEVTTDRLRLPGIEGLHLRPVDEIAETLAVALKARPNVREVRYVIGEYIELTMENR